MSRRASFTGSDLEGLELSELDRARLSGEHGGAKGMAMRILVTMARIAGAQRLLDIEMAHVDGCLYHGDSGLAFAERLTSGGGRVAVLSTLNVGAADLLHPKRFTATSRWRRRHGV